MSVGTKKKRKIIKKKLEAAELLYGKTNKVYNMLLDAISAEKVTPFVHFKRSRVRVLLFSGFLYICVLEAPVYSKFHDDTQVYFVDMPL